MRPISPSQVKAFRTCPRRFAYRYIEGLKEPAGAPAEHGKAMHLQLENWVLRGQQPTHAHALSVVPHGPRPLTALAERKVTWPSVFGHNPWTHLGIIDFTGVLLSLANMRLSPFLEPGAPILFGDYKFTSNIKYALEVDTKRGVLIDRETLQPDPQFAMYADYFYSNGFTDLTGKWIYTTTKGKTRTIPVLVRPQRSAVDDVMGEVIQDCTQIHKLYTIRPKASQVRYNRAGCNSFNQPCPHLSYCELPRRSITDEGDNDMGFADALMSTFPGDPTDSPPIEGEEAPEIPEDMPEIPDGDEEADRGISEIEQMEIINAELAKQRAERGTTEKGFVNPPEAPETAPKTPEEAFERFGDPVVEKPKARKFVGADKPALLTAAIAYGLVERGSRLAAAGLAKLLKQAGHDPAAICDNADPDGLPKDSLQSQANADQAAAYEEAPEPPTPEEEGMVDQVEHNLTGDQLEEQLRAAITADAQDAPGAAEEVERLEKKVLENRASIPELREKVVELQKKMIAQAAAGHAYETSDFDGPTEERARYEAAEEEEIAVQPDSSFEYTRRVARAILDLSVRELAQLTGILAANGVRIVVG